VWRHRCLLSCTNIGNVLAAEKSSLRGTKMNNLLMKLWRDEEGQDLTEYALLLVLLSLAAIGSLGKLATAINGVFANAAANLNT
jgi:pilus assembly protein Flp/PilA